MGHRFLDVDVLSRRERIDEHLFVPVVGGRDDHGLDILLIQELAVVVELGRFRTGLGGGLVAMGLVDVGHGHQVRTLHGFRLPLRNSALNRILRLGDQVVHQLHGSTARPDHADPHPVVGPENLREGTALNVGQSNMPRSGTRGTLEKAAASRFIVCSHAGAPWANHNCPDSINHHPAQTVGQAALSTAFSGRR